MASSLATRAVPAPDCRACTSPRPVLRSRGCCCRRSWLWLSVRESTSRLIRRFENVRFARIELALDATYYPIARFCCHIAFERRDDEPFAVGAELCYPAAVDLRHPSQHHVKGPCGVVANRLHDYRFLAEVAFVSRHVALR